ncbi:hypothetical protein PIB30_067159 [Stylosanthes scabra]|uniref:Uncharacterized protein n=1 Tax=Stylosanthes scabra TaxID=79078 RepID=A0ABU6QM13_9FABA|nr:hypothetical protein [Stylosanthes scabra]
MFLLLPHISVDFHVYAWVFILGLELGWPPRICLLQRIYVGLMNLEVELAFHAYASFSAHMRGSGVGLAWRGSCVVACCQGAFHAYAWVFYAYAWMNEA